VWLYHCFSLSLRDVELILAARGIVISYAETRLAAWLTGVPVILTVH
jgi:transposase-like protein